jgi:hypothetical protein
MFPTMMVILESFNTSLSFYDDLGARHAVIRRGVRQAAIRRAVHYTPLEDIQDDIETRLIEELKHELKERTASYEVVSWEQLPS